MPMPWTHTTLMVEILKDNALSEAEEFQPSLTSVRPRNLTD
jgi:hypothetical protein